MIIVTLTFGTIERKTTVPQHTVPIVKLLEVKIRRKESVIVNFLLIVQKMILLFYSAI